jgi:hypothetical protein
MVRFFVNAVLAITTIPASSWAQNVGQKSPEVVVYPPKNGSTQTQSVPACADLPGDAQTVALVPSYVDEPLKQLKRMVPGLSGIDFQADEKAGDSGSAQTAQSKAAFILSKTGAVVAAMLRGMPDLVAREEVRQLVADGEIGSIGSNGALPDLASSTLGAALNLGAVSGRRVARYETHYFTYRIVHQRNAAGGNSFDELRTDAHDRPVDSSAQNVGRPLSVGFATVWLYFLPGNLRATRFRYLGQQSIGHRKTDVLAFAQIPGAMDLDVVIESGSSTCSTMLQGIAWIDQATFQIVRVQTDLLAPLPGIQLDQLRAILNYGATKIDALNLELWLPTDVETIWQTASRTGEEAHLYSHYRLFKSTARVLPANQSPPR